MEKLNDKYFRFLGVPCVAIVVQTLFFGKNMVLKGNYLQGYTIAILVTTLFWESGRIVLLKVRSQYPSLEETLKRQIILFISLFFLTLVLSVLVQYIFFVFKVFGTQFTFLSLSRYFSIVFTFVLLIAIVYEGIYVFRKWRQTWLETLQLKREKLQTELDSLKTQVSPHFLFNSLNSLSFLVEEDKKLAIEFVEELAQVYRYILQCHEKDFVTLKDEINFSKSYFFVLKQRFGDGLKIDWRVGEETYSWRLPPLTIKTVIENAIAHNVITKKSPLSILAFTDLENNLMISNRVKSKTILVKRKRLGLINLAIKYRLLTEKEMEIFETDSEFEILLPLIEPELVA